MTIDLTPRELAALIAASARATLAVAFPPLSGTTGADLDDIARAIGNNAAQALANLAELGADTPDC